MSKNDGYKSRGATLVEDEPNEPRPAFSSRSRVEKQFLPDKFVEDLPEKRPGSIGNDARIRRRAPVRKGILPLWMKTRAGRVVALLISLVTLAAVVAAALAVRNFFDHDPRFRIESSDSIRTTGNSELTRSQLLSVFGSDIGRDIFYIPLAERRADLEQIPWVEHATVMRILPDQLRVAVRERSPVAFVRSGDQIKLVDGAGVILNMSPAMMAARHFSFPVVAGIRQVDPLSVRAARMQLYQRFVAELDSTGEHLSSSLSEVDLSNPEDVRVTLPAKSSDLLLHFGDTNFLARYRIYQSHLSEWEQQYPQLASVDLRYESEVVLKMAGGAPVESAKPSTGDSPQSATAQTASAAAATPQATTKKTVAAKHEHAAKKHAGRTRA